METEMRMETDPIIGLKAVQTSRIRDGFNLAPLNGCMTSYGIKMDAKREDIDNLTRLRDRIIETDTGSTVIRDFDNQFHTVTVEELSEIIGELIDFGLGLYARKWELEQTLYVAKTGAEVLAVVW